MNYLLNLPGFKRFFDLFFAFCALALAWPILILIAAAIKLTSPGTIFFIQTRLGQFGQPFKIYKFRTMTPQMVTKDTLTLADDKRLTKIGRWLRRYKLDELPQFVNVLQGHMSVVGPRPDVPQYYDLGNPLHQKVLSVKPGVTCFGGIEYSLSKNQEDKILAKAQVPEEAYRNQIFPAKMALNLKYVEERSFALDLKIIGLTIYYLIKKIIK
ncbi:MAG TPA: hypothetical protein DDX47_00380 [Candidatus Jacksonbacteria bacterium]|nr:MAG: Sugar transferase [Parcubacteria group bacterium GW2011_GWC2_44_22]OGY76474.1 MAG: hypothetical protein A2295_02375 [Candidatus Jacksonbacteria bacterium RIFOXYB2_FULL_44_15]OGY76845.1 MAG: hypothetical protein A2240_04710 [Candidatus Jacksonbacteria bacterium RIFOXYA2_FULL_43_12]OGY82204.1 MAG: hypothetical protein A2550_05880 [Candidatus Jacksonbacteria bacterium RIFOXYD2_FULL_43_21]HBH45812.1 hypothetical protein [Candidatus Jacksonbacteria bacterium]